MELLEYFDEENKNSLGVCERDLVHKDNLWHREVAVWIMNEKNELLLQRRSAKKKQGANKLSITAGHVDVKEDEAVSAVREVKEEIGLDIDLTDLIFIDIYRNQQENNYCFSYTYLVKTNKKIEEMKIQEDEVSELKYISIGELEDRINNQDEEIPFVKKSYIKIIIERIKNEFVTV